MGEMTLEKLAAIIGHAERQGPYRFGFGYDDDQKAFFVGYEFGKEAPDSPMFGGASYGSGETLDQALDEVIKECRIGER